MNCAEYQELLVAYLEGMLEESPKQAVKAHVKGCQACRTQLQELQTLQQRLVDSGQVLAQTSVEEEVMNRIVREQSARLKAVTQAGAGLRVRRLIMKSSMAKIAVAAAVVLACAGGFYLVGSTKNVALADVLDKVERVPAFMYRMTMHTKGPMGNMPAGEADIEATALISNDYGMKMDSTVTTDTGQKTTQQTYVLLREKKMVTVVPEFKQYMRMDIDESLLERMNNDGKDPRIMIRQILASKYEELGHSTIDGVPVEGFRTTDPAYGGGVFENIEVKLWVNTKTWLPARMEMHTKVNEQAEMEGTLYDFQWDVPASATAFTPAIPADFTAGPGDGIKLPPMTEETAVEGLRLCAALTGHYPENLNVMTLMQMMGECTNSQTPEALKLRQQLDQAPSNDEKMKKTVELMMPVNMLGAFYATLVQEKKEPAYYGKAVKPGDVAQVLLRWKTGENEYRVIFADLHAETVNADTLAKLEAGLPK